MADFLLKVNESNKGTELLLRIRGIALVEPVLVCLSVPRPDALLQLSVFSVTCVGVSLCVAVLIFFTAAFASAVVCLPQSLGTSSRQLRDFLGWPLAFESMLAMAFNSYGGNNCEEMAVADESHC